MIRHSFLSTATFACWFSVLFHTITVVALSPITAVGAKFFDGDGNQFFIKGVAYQLTLDDPLIDTKQCQLDAALMKELGANTIRVYHVDPTGDHDGCMTAFDNAGIYLFVDLETFDDSIVQAAPSWNQTKLSNYETVLDTFHVYDNLAGVFVGNEVLTMLNGSQAAPYVKAAARDVKKYRDEKGYRQIPVGYAAADIESLRPMLQNYFACSADSADNLDFYSLNAYEWCGDSSYTESGYNMLQKNATNYNIPIFFSETGCNQPEPRTFQDQAAIFGPEMDGTWSGAIIYEWIEETNNYGLVSYGPYNPSATASTVEGGYTRGGTPTPVSPDFSNLKAVWSTVSPQGVALSDYTASASAITPVACPSSTAGGWNVDPSSSLPTLGQTAVIATNTGGSGSSASGTAAGGSSSSATSATSKGAASSIYPIRLSFNADGMGKLMTSVVGFVAVMCWWL